MNFKYSMATSGIILVIIMIVSNTESVAQKQNVGHINAGEYNLDSSNNVVKYSEENTVIHTTQFSSEALKVRYEPGQVPANYPPQISDTQDSDELLRGSGMGSISGRVTNSMTGNGISNTIVYIYDLSHNYVTGYYVDNDGYFQTPANIAVGSYNVFTWSAPGHINEVYGDIQCYITCYNETGVPVTVTDGVDTSDIDFQLDEGNYISGTVSDSVTNLNLPYSGYIRFYDSNFNSISARIVDNGYYQSTALESGIYYALSENYIGYINELYDQVCLIYCDPTTGTPIDLTLTSAVGINFSLAPGAVFSGQITDSVSMMGLQNYYVSVYNNNGQFVVQTYTSNDGFYQMPVGLPQGSYFIRTAGNNTNQYIEELYDDIPCIGSCDLTIGQEFVVTDASAITGVDFALDQAITISGQVTDSDSGLGIQSIQVSFYNLVNNFPSYVGYAFSNSIGEFVSPPLEAGTYYLRTYNSQGYINEIYDDIQCGNSPCIIVDGSAVILNQSVTGINFSLDKGAVISGMVTDYLTGSAITSGYNSMTLFNSSGQPLYSFGTWPQPGTYSFPGMPDGTYYIKAGNGNIYISELYDDIPCPSNCDVTTGDTITITNKTNVGSIDFALEKPDDVFANGFE